jgi:tRNA dimethylallyltransferase
MNKILIISGPTAMGKTGLALKLAKLFDGEIISADSRQVYKGMDVITGKDLPEDSKLTSVSFRTDANLPIRKTRQSDVESTDKDNLILNFYEIGGVRIWGLDMVEPDQDFDVSHFIQFANFIIKNICNRDKLPIIVGGTGFWIKSLLNPPDTVGIAIDKKLRQELEKLSISDLQKKLQQIDVQKFDQMNNSDKNNPRRLVRAIEVGLHTPSNSVKSGIDPPLKRGLSESKKDKIIPSREGHSDLVSEGVCWLGLKIDEKLLAEKIEKRIKQRIENGALREVKKLITKGYSWDLPSMTGIGYRDFKAFIENKQTFEKTIKLWTLHETQYAKRQMTFFNKIKNIQWFDVAKKESFDDIKLQVQKYLENG